MELTKEQIEQLKACTTVEEVKKVAKNTGSCITDEHALALLKEIEAHHIPETEGKVSDDALANVDGGLGIGTWFQSIWLTLNSKGQFCSCGES